MDCNNALQQLKFQGAGQALLTISVNDLGNYGCYFECLQDMSLPLQSQATINLIRSWPMKSSVARCKLELHYDFIFLHSAWDNVHYRVHFYDFVGLLFCFSSANVQNLWDMRGAALIPARLCYLMHKTLTKQW